MRVTGLYEYPVKGLRGNRLCCAAVNKRGLGMDRRWMLVDGAGKFISQRQLTALTGLQPVLEDHLLIRHLASGNEMMVDQAAFTATVEVEVWGQVFKAHAAVNSINPWLSDVLGQEVTLVYMAEEDYRPLKSSPADPVSFADGYPVLLTCQSSLDDLNSRLEAPVNMGRFRSNIVVGGLAPYAEDNWQRLQIGAIRFRVAKRCARCHVVTIDQQTGTTGKEPLRTLGTYRREGKKVYFGVNLIPENTGIIHENDPVTILA